MTEILYILATVLAGIGAFFTLGRFERGGDI